MNQAERIIEKFEQGTSWLAYELDTSPSTVSTWKARGTIPRWWHPALLGIAKRHKINLSKDDFGK